MSGTALLGGYAADLALGDPRRFHPVAGFGQIALAAERAVYAPSRWRGIAFAGTLVAAAAVAAESAARLGERSRVGRGGVLAAVTWAALGGHSLVCEARRLASHLDEGDLEAARAVLPSLCGRDADGLDASGLARATVESVAENTADAVIGVLFWGTLAGPAGVGAYRAANTLDAMIGHHSERYESFGWAAAKLDDVLNWPVARSAALLAAVCAPISGGSPRRSWRTVKAFGGAHPSPNAGQIEAAFAGALDLRLGGPLTYAGQVEVRPTLGTGRAPDSGDVRRATRLSLAVGVTAAALSAIARRSR